MPPSSAYALLVLPDSTQKMIGSDAGGAARVSTTEGRRAARAAIFTVFGY